MATETPKQQRQQQPKRLPQTQRVEEIKSAIEEKATTNVTNEELKSWLGELYDVSKFSEVELAEYYEIFRYKGFDRSEVLKQLKVITHNDTKLAGQIIMVCALRGPRAAAATKLTNGMTPSELGIPGSGTQKTLKISCQRITAATADLAAFFMKRMNVPKRLNHPLVAWLQFPSAGAIKMSDNIRDLHIDWSKRFSPLIGGVFREDIYMQMVANSYLDENLHLFDMM